MRGGLHVEELQSELPFVFQPRPPNYPWPVFDPGEFDRVEIDASDFYTAGAAATVVTKEIEPTLAGVGQADRDAWTSPPPRDEAPVYDLDTAKGETLLAEQVPARRNGESGQRSPVGPPPPHDAAAWYQPFHFFPTDWGIFLKESAIVDIATILCDGVKALTGKAPDRRLITECTRASFLILFEHEFFHHQVECFSARCEVYLRAPVYVPQFRAPHWLVEEALANARAYMKTRPGGALRLDPVVAAAAKLYQDITFPFAPPGYRDAVRYLTAGRFAGGVNNLQESVHEHGGGSHRAASRIWKAAPHEIRGFGNKASPIYCVVDHVGARRLPPLFYSFSSQDLERLAEAKGFRIDRKGGKGSHAKAVMPGRRPVVIPENRKDVASGTSRSVLRGLGYYSPQEAIAALRA
jgi:predicted RNA binding protein YcfA (HicA-like mRNA interferase family)